MFGFLPSKGVAPLLAFVFPPWLALSQLSSAALLNGLRETTAVMQHCLQLFQKLLLWLWTLLDLMTRF